MLRDAQLARALHVKYGALTVTQPQQCQSHVVVHFIVAFPGGQGVLDALSGPVPAPQPRRIVRRLRLVDAMVRLTASSPSANSRARA